MTIITITESDVEHLLDSAIHYAAGRSTYVVGSVCRTLHTNLNRIPNDMGARLAEPIIERSHMPHGLGMDFDRAKWMGALKELQATQGAPDGRLEFSWDVDAEILFFSAFRWDMDDPAEQHPEQWIRYTRQWPDILLADKWRYNTARDLLWAEWIPEDEPKGELQPCTKEWCGDNRWLEFFRLMRDGRKQVSQ